MSRANPRKADPGELPELALGVVDAIGRMYARLGTSADDHFTETELKILDLVFSSALIIAERRQLQFKRDVE